MRRDVRQFFREAKRRKIWNVLAVYIAVSLGLMSAASYMFPALDVPPLYNTILAVMLLFGLPVAGVLAWAYDVVPDGLPRTEAVTSAPAQRTASVGSIVQRPPRPVPRLATSPARVPAAPTDEPATPPDPTRVRRASLAQLKHSLRTPINAMVGYADILLEDGSWDDQPELRAELAELRAASTRTLDRIDVALQPAGDDDEDGPLKLGELPSDLPAGVAAVSEQARSLADRAAAAGLTESAGDLERIVSAAAQLNSLIQEIAPGAPGGAARLEQASVAARSVLGSIRAVGRALPDVQEGSLLVVDDHAMNRDLLARQLARQGYSVATAGSGAEALAKLGTHSFDLILLDVIMPEMNGLEVLQRLKASPASAEIPVMMISALDELDSVVRCIEMGADDYLAKPFDPVLLRARIRSNLRLGQVRRLERAYADELEAVQAFNTRLVSSLAPAELARDLSFGNPVLHFVAEATCLYAALDGIPRPVTASGAARVLDLLASLFSGFEESAARLGLTFTHAGARSYVVLTGVPGGGEHNSASLASLAQELVSATEQRAQECGEPIRIRVGLHTAPALVGAVPAERVRMHLAGEAFEVARLLAHQAQPGSVHLSPATYLRVQDRFVCEARPVTSIGPDLQMRTFVLTR